MESIAWVELLGPRGQVLHRQPVFAWPIRIGPHYVGDIVIDDRTFPDAKIELYQGDGGQDALTFCFEVVQSSSANASKLRLNGKSIAIDSPGRLIIGGNDVLECGSTRMRIRIRGHEVEHPPKNVKAGWSKSWVFATGIAFAAVFWNGYFSFVNSLNEDASAQFTEAFKSTPILILWWALWATISRLVSGSTHAREHLLISGIFIFLSSNWSHIGSAIAFSTGIYGFTTAGSVLVVLTLGLALYAHLSFVKPVGLGIGLFRSTAITVFVWMWMFDGASVLYPPEQKPMDYDTSMWPSLMVVTKGDSPEQFLQNLDKAKGKLDQTALLIASRH